MGILTNHLASSKAFAAGLLAAFFCSWLGTPLPWIIGPLFASAGLRMAGVDLRCPVPARASGQWAIGTVLGLYFTPPVLAELAGRAPLIALAVAFALGLGWLCARMLQRLAGVDRATAFFAMALGGASEMAVQGERHGAVVQHVAAAQGLRLMFVVTVLPFGLQYWAASPPAAIAGPVSMAAQGGLGGFALLACATCSAGWFLMRRGTPNAWVLGPMLAAGLLAAAGVPVGRVPEWMVRTGQLCIGLSLGTRFTPAFLYEGPRYMAAVASCTVAALGLAALFGLALAQIGGIHPATAMLATSPGGIAEMALTARALHLDVPVVTAFHVCRMVVLVLAVGPAFRRMVRG